MDDLLSHSAKELSSAQASGFWMLLGDLFRRLGMVAEASEAVERALQIATSIEDVQYEEHFLQFETIRAQVEIANGQEAKGVERLLASCQWQLKCFGDRNPMVRESIVALLEHSSSTGSRDYAHMAKALAEIDREIKDFRTRKGLALNHVLFPVPEVITD